MSLWERYWAAFAYTWGVIGAVGTIALAMRVLKVIARWLL